MTILKEFKAFAMRGNLLDIAVGIIIGAAFGKIVSSMVADVLMPPIGILIGGVDFSDLSFPLKNAELSSDGKIIKEAVVISYGKFLQSIIDFVIITFAIFMLIKLISKIKKDEEIKAETTPIKTDEVILLTEIRDLLKR